MIDVSALEKVRTFAIVLRNLFVGSSVVSLSLLRRPRRMVEYIQMNLFYYAALLAKGLPHRNIQDVFQKDSETVALKFCDFEQGWFSIDSSYTKDIFSLCLICQVLKPKVIFEIGTLNGYTARHFALNTELDAVIYTLDLPDKNGLTPTLSITIIDKYHILARKRVGKLSFEGKPEGAKVRCLYGDSATFDFAPFSGKVDFFFIDGAHSYEYVRSDTLYALKCCHPGSLIAWHDYGRVGVNGVSRWLHTLARSRNIYRIPGSSIAFMKVD